MGSHGRDKGGAQLAKKTGENFELQVLELRKENWRKLKRNNSGGETLLEGKYIGRTNKRVD